MEQMTGESVHGEEENLLSIIADRYCVTILKAVEGEHKSAAQISSECGIFIGKVYRRLKVLRGNGLLDVQCGIRRDGKKIFFYKSLVRDIVISLSGGKVGVSVNLKAPQLGGVLSA